MTTKSVCPWCGKVVKEKDWEGHLDTCDNGDDL